MKGTIVGNRLSAATALAVGATMAAYAPHSKADVTTEAWVYPFTTQSGDGAYPNLAGLVLGPDGNYYGSDAGYGAYIACGTIYRITAGGAESVVYSFLGGTDGCAPDGGILVDSDGTIYGVTNFNGANGYGTLFSLSTAGVLTTLHAFNSLDGRLSQGPMIKGSDGNLYGTTDAGGAGGAGVLFKVTPDGSYSILHSFGTSTADGQVPEGAIVQTSDGNLYGTTLGGGVEGAGTVYRLTAAGNYSTIYSFSLAGFQGTAPKGLAPGADGYLYGITERGGALGDDGTVYRISTSGKLTSLHSFIRYYYDLLGGYTEGYSPLASLTLGYDGNLYGTTPIGKGTIFSSPSTVFRMTPDGVFSTLYDFGVGTGDPEQIISPVLLGADGGLYGTSSEGGSGKGAAYKLIPAGAPVGASLQVRPATTTVQSPITLKWSSSNAARCFAASSNNDLYWSRQLSSTSGNMTIAAPTHSGRFWYAIGCIDAAGATTSTSSVVVLVRR